MSAPAEQAAAAAASVLTPHRRNSGTGHPIRRASQDDHYDFQSRAPDGAGYRRRTSIMEDKERWVGTALTVSLTYKPVIIWSERHIGY